MVFGSTEKGKIEKSPRKMLTKRRRFHHTEEILNILERNIRFYYSGALLVDSIITVVENRVMQDESKNIFILSINYTEFKSNDETDINVDDNVKVLIMIIVPLSHHHNQMDSTEGMNRMGCRKTLQMFCLIVGELPKKSYWDNETSTSEFFWRKIMVYAVTTADSIFIANFFQNKTSCTISV